MNPKQFLQIGGVILVVVGILGFVGVLGPGEDDSIFGKAWWFDNAENWAHLILGVVGFACAYILPASLQKGLVMLLGVIGVLVGLYSLFGSRMLGGAHLENPADSVLHLAIGVWALWASMMKGSPMSGPAQM